MEWANPSSRLGREPSRAALALGTYRLPFSMERETASSIACSLASRHRRAYAEQEATLPDASPMLSNASASIAQLVATSIFGLPSPVRLDHASESRGAKGAPQPAGVARNGVTSGSGIRKFLFPILNQRWVAWFRLLLRECSIHMFIKRRGHMAHYSAEMGSLADLRRKSGSASRNLRAAQ